MTVEIVSWKGFVPLEGEKVMDSFVENLEHFLGMPMKDFGGWAAGVMVILVVIGLCLKELLKSKPGTPTDPPQKPKELRHFIAYLFVGVGGIMLLNSVVLFNIYAFGGQLTFWHPFSMFVGALVSTGVAAMSRYCEDTPKTAFKAEAGCGTGKAADGRLPAAQCSDGPGRS
jgi:hypothetical protein